MRKKMIWTYSFYWRDSRFNESVEIATKLARRVLYIETLLQRGNYCQWWLANEGQKIAGLFVKPFSDWDDMVLDEDTCFLIRKYAHLIWSQGYLRVKQWKYLREHKDLPEQVREKILYWKILSSGDLYYITKPTWEYQNNPLGTRVGDYVRQRISVNIQSYFKALKRYNKNPAGFTGIPRFPKMVGKNDYMTIEVDKKNANITHVGQKLVLKIGSSVAYKKTHPAYISPEICIPIYNDMFLDRRFQTIKIKPVLGDLYKISICYEKRIIQPNIDETKYLSLDLGGKVLMAGARNDTWDPFLISAIPIRNKNEYTIFQIGKFQRILSKKTNTPVYWTKQMHQLSIDRTKFIETFLHNASSWIIDYCIINKIGNIVIGHNKGWKQNMKQRNKSKKGTTGFYYHKNRRMFGQIPFDKLIHKITYKAESLGINVIEREESNTSYLSALDCEYLPATPIKKDKNNKKRLHRGSFQWSGGIIHADVNGALNILRKEIGDDFIPVLRQQKLLNAKFISI